MVLRCLLFSSDEGTAHSIGQVLTDLGMEGEYCRLAVEAVKRVTSEAFQIIIVDWDNQPEAGFLIKTARERKASERPLSLAIVSNDANVPQALQSGANSVLRKPILANQVKDTLTTARDLLRTRVEPPATAAMAAAAGAGAAAVTSLPSSAGDETHLHAGEFLQSSGPGPGAQFIIDSDARKAMEQASVAEINPLKDLTPMAESVESMQASAAAAPAPLPDEPRGLSFYLKGRAGAQPPQEASGTESSAPGYDETPSYGQPPAGADEQSAPLESPPPVEAQRETEHPAEAALFAYITGESQEKKEPLLPRLRAMLSNLGLSRIALVGALLVVCAVAYLKVPPDRWGKNLHLMTGYAAGQLHAWLNPTLVTTPQAPVTHDSFGRAGDEYKLPVAENIPDATTDPSQIRVLPVIDPTAKQPNPAANNANQTTAPTDAATPPGDPSEATPVAGTDTQPAPVTPTPIPAATDPNASPDTTVPAATNVPQPSLHTETSAPATPPVVPQSPPPSKRSAVPQNLSPSTTSNASIPSSLKSQMASMTPDASGNKLPEAALPAIEPVNLTESAERALLAQQTNPVYPDAAKGQQGTVVLAVLIGRDGTVQDAKFLQGSLAFARSAIDAVQQWKFKPYVMNGRPVSVQTQITLTFKPTAQ